MPDEIIEQSNLNKDSILDSLNSEETETSEEEPKVDLLSEDKDEEKEEEKEEEDSSDEDDEDEEEEQEEVKIDETEYTAVPRRAEILKAFPDLFKKFPGIEKSIYREQQYAEVFPTLDEARAAQQDVQRFKNLESDLLEGQIAPLFAALKKSNGDSYQKIADNLLETMYEVDQDAYKSILNQVVQNTLAQAHKLGKDQKNDQLEIAAEILYKTIYGTTEVKAFEKQQGAVQPNTEAEKLRQQQIEFARQQLQAAANDIGTRAQNVIKSSIDKNLDPKGLMSSYVRTKAVDDVLSEVNQAFESDKQFRSLIDNLYKKAASENYSEASKLKIRNALLAKAQSVLPGIISKVRTAALHGERKTIKKRAVEKTPITRSEKQSAKPARGMSTLDFLNSD